MDNSSLELARRLTELAGIDVPEKRLDALAGGLLGSRVR